MHDNTISGWALLIIIAAVAAIGVCQATGAGLNSGSAEKTARAWARENGVDLEHVTCATADSDGDGRVSCSVKVRGESWPRQLECAAALNLQTGCREPKVIVPAAAR